MDSIFGIGFPELVFIAVLALIILGPERLPSTLREVAKYWGYIRNLSSQLTSQFSEEFKVLNELNPKKLLNEMADEEMAKEAKAKPPATPATSAKTPTPTKPTTPAKPATTATTAPKTPKTEPNQSSTSATVAKAAPAAATTNSEQPAKTASTDSLPPASTAAGPGENSILPPAVPADSSTAPPAPDSNAANGTGHSSDGAETAQPAASAEPPPDQPVLVSVATSSLNGAKDPAEVAE